MIENRPTSEAVFNHLQLVQEKENASGKCPIDAAIVGRYGAFVGSVIECHSFLPRAMDYARDLIKKTVRAGGSVPSGTVILADSMNRSKGRFTRHWHAPEGGVWGCLIHANTLLPQSRHFVPLATGLACCEAVRDAGVERAVLRWVNDVLVDGKKLAGFLVESYTEPVHCEEFTLVGFGINVNNCSFPAELIPSSISFKQLSGKGLVLSEFTALFLARLAWNFGLLYFEEASELRGEGFSGNKGKHLLLERWLACSDTVGQKVMYGFDVMTAPQYRAEVLGIDDHGGLILRLEDGHEKKEYSGEIRYL
jgi:BirA family transcriptional regulator, biotin operon repressor / biotin---[acetyl-CoA-carboxylase] ligase